MRKELESGFDIEVIDGDESAWRCRVTAKGVGRSDIARLDGPGWSEDAPKEVKYWRFVI